MEGLSVRQGQGARLLTLAWPLLGVCFPRGGGVPSLGTCKKTLRSWRWRGSPAGGRAAPAADGSQAENILRRRDLVEYAGIEKHVK